jgi:hypothetical protein
MQKITRFSLASVMFFLFSVSCPVTSVSAQIGAPGMAPVPPSFAPGTAQQDCTQQQNKEQAVAIHI